jgi:uncharacterized repeat protein (TIGR03803 family)
MCKSLHVDSVLMATHNYRSLQAVAPSGCRSHSTTVVTSMPGNENLQPGKESWQTPGKAMVTVAIVFIIILASASDAWAQRKYKTLYTFNVGTDGYEPADGVTFDAAGHLYGTTFQGGTYRGGTVFKLVPHPDGSWREMVLHSFRMSDGWLPFASLIFDQAGNLYGTTPEGGTDGFGIVFELMPTKDGSWTESVIHSFTGGADGAGPVASLVFDQSGNLYGTTTGGGFSSTCTGGCGTVFKLTPKSNGHWTEGVLYSFCSVTECRDGLTPVASLIFDQVGNLYGTTQYGGNLNHCRGTNGCGLVFELTPNADGSWKEKVLHSFCPLELCDDGAFPLDNLIFDQAAGNLYGTTNSGGAAWDGLVFQLIPNGDGTWKEKVLHAFTGRDGSAPYGNVTFDRSGNLYGTTQGGGAYGAGTVFKLVLDLQGGWHETVLHSFRDHPGAFPYAGVIFGPSGNLYGTTYGNFNATFGSVFEIVP